jgi:cytochrome c
MDRWELTKAIGGVAAALAVLGASVWVSGLVMSPSYPQQRGYALEGVPPVALAALQRDWPGGGAPDERSQLLGYMAHIDKAVVPAVATTAAGPALPVADLGTLLAAADPARGERTAQVCAACHSFDQGGPNRVGPNLWGVVGRPVGSHAGFAYSAAVKGHGGAWTYEELDRYLTSPARDIPGNKMAFSGLRNPRDRANLLAYLASLSPAAPPFPAPQPIPAEVATAPGATAP